MSHCIQGLRAGEVIGSGREAGTTPKGTVPSFTLERVVILVRRLEVFAGARTRLPRKALLVLEPDFLSPILVNLDAVLAKFELDLAFDLKTSLCIDCNQFNLLVALVAK